MKTYELTYIVSPEITSEEAEAKAKEVETLISGKEGTILKQSNPIAKTLAYPIAKRASGFFGVLEFQLEPEKLLELKEILTKDGKIVRQMITIKKPVKPQKERRTRIKPVTALEVEKKIEVEPAKKEKVELKDIEQELEDILG